MKCVLVFLAMERLSAASNIERRGDVCVTDSGCWCRLRLRRSEFVAKDHLLNSSPTSCWRAIRSSSEPNRHVMANDDNLSDVDVDVDVDVDQSPVHSTNWIS